MVGTELMKVLDKDGNNFTVERGYLNTEIKKHEIGVQVKAVKNLNKNTLISNFAYAVFRNEKGLRFQLPLGPELSSSILISKIVIMTDIRLKITTFSWDRRLLPSLVNHQLIRSYLYLINPLN